MKGRTRWPAFLDTNRDNNVSSIHALLVINAINNGQAGEGESAPADSTLDYATLILLLASDTAGKPRRRRL